MKNKEQYVKENIGYQWKIPKMAVNPFPCGYEPTIDELQEINPVLSSYYLSHIGILCWMVELGSIDINIEVSMMASQSALMREEHLEEALKIVSYLRGKRNYRLYLDPTYLEIDHVSFKKHKWVDLYGNVKEAIPLNMPEPRGKDIDLRTYVDRNNAGDKSTIRSRTGFLIYTDVTLIQWIYKKQPII